MARLELACEATWEARLAVSDEFAAGSRALHARSDGQRDRPDRSPTSVAAMTSVANTNDDLHSRRLALGGQKRLSCCASVARAAGTSLRRALVPFPRAGTVDTTVPSIRRDKRETVMAVQPRRRSL